VFATASHSSTLVKYLKVKLGANH